MTSAAPSPETRAAAPAPRRTRRFGLNPTTAQRLRRFRGLRRGFWSLVLLLILYGLSLFAEFLANDKPLFLRFRGRSFWPVLRSYNEDEVAGTGRFTRPDYKAIADSDAFRGDPSARILWPPLPYGPLESVPPEETQRDARTTVHVVPDQPVAAVYVDRAGALVRSTGAGPFFGAPDDASLAGRRVWDAWTPDDGVRRALDRRFANEASEDFAGLATNAAGRTVRIEFPPFAPRTGPPASVRATFREEAGAAATARTMTLGPAGAFAGGDRRLWEGLSEAERRTLSERAMRPDGGSGPAIPLALDGRAYRASMVRERGFPFRPTPRHPCGLDSSGRDVLARLVYGMRMSVSFGLLLVVTSMFVGTAVGAVQGFFGGRVDLTGQRLIEVWESIPFLYVLILLGSVYGPSFLLLLVVYGLFNWIGISYYMRGEYLRLRPLAFVEAARGLGAGSARIMFRHILPNALVPLITFFPFSLVSAIASLTGLDYLGFGLPPPTPSWGELFAQAQEHRWAWWLVLYPGLALFVVMLLCVFVGEGVREAFDPRRRERWE